VITSTAEHHAVLHAVEDLQRKEGFRVTWLPVDSRGRTDPGQLADAFTSETALVSIMSANNETGTLQPVREMARLCRERGVLFHTDAIQSFGKEEIDARDFDAVSIAAHKFYGPKGVGLLYVRAGIPIERLQVGGSHENERRAGTENVAAIVGMATAAELVTRERAEEQSRQAMLRDRLWSGIRALFPTAILNGDLETRLANTVNISFPGLDAETLLINLDLAGICASSGSACMVGSFVASHVLLAMGVAPEIARGTVRFSLGKTTTAEEINRVLELLPAIFARLQPELV
jgi:cysteine desulfurase